MRFLVSLLLLCAATAAAQSYPTRAVLDKASAAGLDKEYYPALLKVIGQ